MNLKKEIIFYVVVVIFITTAVTTFLGVYGIYPIKESYLDIFVTSMLIEVTAAVIGLFIKTDFIGANPSKTVSATDNFQSSETATTNTDSVIDNTTNTTELDSSNSKLAKPKGKTDLSAEEYFKKYNNLKGRFLEQEEFTKGMFGYSVAWHGYVKSVTSYSNSGTIYVLANNQGLGGVVAIQIDKSLLTKAYALQEDDYIIFKGVIADTAVLGLTIENATFELANSPTETKDAEFDVSLPETDPLPVIKRRVENKAQFENHLAELNGSHIIVRDVHRHDLYPELDEKPGISPWFELEFKSLSDKGVEIFSSVHTLKYVNGKGRWFYCSAHDPDHVNALLIGCIPYEMIMEVDWAGNQDHSFPHLYCDWKSSPNNEPYVDWHYVVPKESTDKNSTYYLRFVDQDSVMPNPENQ